jgi:Protein of unknown function (DUF1573)
MRNAILAFAVLAFGTAGAPAQGWAEKMFKDGMSHDFGSVPRGAQLLHRFPITNIYAVRMEITGIVPGCGCVTATASKRVLEPRETAYIDVNMDARRFTGNKNVAIRVSVGPEYTSSADIKVTATSRADIVFNPGEVNLGTVTPGTAPSQTVDVEYAGPLNWTVSEAMIAKELPLEASLKELYRRPGQVGYRLSVTLKPDAQSGDLKQYVYLKTNDPAGPLVPVLVEAKVQSAVTVSPEKLTLSGVKTGDSLTRRVVVRGSKPFRILGIEGLGEGVALGAEASTTPAEVQTVTFKCQFDKSGDIHRELKIKTDLQDAPVVVTLDGSVSQ